MSTSNLKTSIAALSLCVSAVVIYIHLPYGIAAVSGSGAIEALPLAIFAVSAIVALVSVIYLIRLAVSRADNKKEEPQKFVCKNCTNLENKPNVPAPQSPPVTLGTQLNPSVSAPPPPPPLPLLLPPGGLANWNPSENNTTSEKPSVGTTQKNTPPDKKYEDKRQVPISNDDIINGMANLRKTMQPNNGIDGQQGPVKGSDAEEFAARIDREQAERRKSICSDLPNGMANLRKTMQPNNGIDGQQGPVKGSDAEEFAARIDREQAERRESIYSDLLKRVQERAVAMEFSDSESESSGRESGSSDEDEQEEVRLKQKTLTKHRRKSTPSNLQSNHGERSGSPDSGCGDDVGSRATSPSNPVPKVEEPSLPPKPVNLKTKSEAPPASQVNEVQEPSALSFKERMALFGGEALRYQRGSVAQRS